MTPILKRFITRLEIKKTASFTILKQFLNKYAY